MGEVSLKDKIDEWCKIYGQGWRIMIESGQESKYQCAATTTYTSIGVERA